MKRILACVLALAMLLTALCSCSAEKENESEILLATSFYPVYIFTLNLVNGINEISVECMAEQNTGCLHDYQLLSKDARLISDADAFIINGAGMEEFLEDVLASAENVIDASKGIEPEARTVSKKMSKAGKLLAHIKAKIDSRDK